MQLMRKEHFITVRGCTDVGHNRNEDIRDNYRLRKYNVVLGRVLATTVAVEKQ
jgi:hypothetical protein